MKKTIFWALCAGSWLLTVVPGAVAQDRGSAERRFGDSPPDNRPRRGPRSGDDRGFGGGPGGRAGGREKGELRRLWRGIDRLDASNAPLSKAQSKRMVALVLPWSKRPQMTAAEAGKLNQSLLAVLTTPQKSAALEAPRRRGGGRGNGFGPPNEPPRDGGRFDGPPPPNRPGERRMRGGEMRGGEMRGGEMRGGRSFGRGAGGAQLSAVQRQSVRAWMQNANPFYAPTGTTTWKSLPVEFQKDVARRYGDNRATLEAISRRSR